MTSSIEPAGTTERIGILFGLVAMVLYSASDGVWKYCLFHTPMAAVFCVNFAASAVALILYTRLANISLQPRKTWCVAGVTVFFVFEQLTFVYALGRLPMAELFVIILTTPLFVLISAHMLLHEKLSSLQIASVLAGFGGALIVVLSHADGNSVLKSPSHNVAILAAVANVVIGGSKILFMRRYCRDENGYALGLAIALVFAMGSLAFTGPSLSHIPIHIDIWLCLSGALSTIGMIAYVAATQKARAPLMAATQYSQIIWAVLMGTLIFHEPLSTAAIIGALLIIVSGIFLYSGKSYEAVN